MKAGRELDALIAEKVMGWHGTHPLSNFPWQQVPPECDPDLAADDPALVLLGVPNYSTDIAAAWEVVERMMRDEFEFELSGDYLPNTEGFTCFFLRRMPKTVEIHNDGANAIAATVPLAICRAALKAVMNE